MPQTRVAVLAKLPGTLSRVAVDIGDRVRAGQVVAALDRREIDAQVDAATASVNVARAGVESAEAGLANALLEHERAQNLFEKGAVPRQRLDAAETRGARRAPSAICHRQARTGGSGAAARGEVQRDATLTSPIDGVVVERNYDAGSLVSPGDEPVVVVADLRVMKLQAGVSELEAGRLRVGMPARVTTQARPGEIVEGRLAAIAPEVDARNRHFANRGAYPEPRHVLSGMYGIATIPLQRVDGSWQCRAKPSPRATASASRSGSRPTRFARYPSRRDRATHVHEIASGLKRGRHDCGRRAARCRPAPK